MSKRGQSSTIGVTIAIVLGITLIIFLIWGFSTNWQIFSGTGSGFTGKTNLDNIERACELQFDNGQKNEFCLTKKAVTLPDGTKASYSCFDLVAGTDNVSSFYRIALPGDVGSFCGPLIERANQLAVEQSS